MSTPGFATFPVGVVQVPMALHVQSGNGGAGTARLELGFGTAVFTSCTYAGAVGGATGTPTPGAMTIDLTASERRFSLDAAGDVIGVDGSDSSRIPLPMTEGQSLGVKIALA